MSNETKRTLLKVAHKMLDREGIDKLSMRELGRQADLSRTAMYRHFDNKLSLLAAIAAEDFESLLSQMIELEKIATEPKQFLRIVLKAYYQFAMEHDEHYQLMFNTKWDNEKYPEIKESAFRVFQKTEKIVMLAVKSGNSQDASPKEITAILYAFIHGLVELHLGGHNEVDKGLSDPEELISRIIGALF